MSRATLPPALARTLRHWRWQSALPTLLAFTAALSIPWTLLQLELPPWLAIAVATTIALAALAWLIRHIRQHDATWLLRRLDAALPSMEDSSDLLLANPTQLGPLERLQHQRILDRLSQTDSRTVLPRPRWLPALMACAVAALLLASELLLPARTPPVPAAPATPVSTDAAATQHLSADVRITPPPYTGLPERTQPDLNLTAEEGATIHWTLRFALPPTTARLRFVDGTELPLQPGTGHWTAERSATASTLYRIELDGAPAPPQDSAYRLEVRPDLAPELAIEQPTQTLTLLAQGASHWNLAFTARDDHGLGPATLTLTLAQGEGEQVAVSERSLTLPSADTDPRTRRYAHRVDLSALGFDAGSDLIARIELRDNRAPTPNLTRSPALILRWPGARAGQGSGVEGLVQNAMPAYFRSQRQIIIDTEALLAEWDGLPADTRTRRSDALGVDQRILRLRYGQFLGEEAEDVEPPPGYEEHAGTGHDHDEAPPTPTRFGEESGEIAAAGHLHDLPEAATLLDPETRRILRAALREMWQSELHLRLGEPAEALPYAYRALDYIKQVQQANRIYLARVGLEVTPVDPARRLTGERDPIPPRPDPLLPRELDSPLPAWWTALDQGEALPWDELARWVREQDLADPLAVLADIDQLQRGPCTPCRARLRDALWPLLPMAVAAPATRPEPDAVGTAWLQSLQRSAREPQP